MCGIEKCGVRGGGGGAGAGVSLLLSAFSVFAGSERRGSGLVASAAGEW